jgi:hypothetical protein
VRGFGRLIDVCNYPLSRFESRFAVNNRLLMTWKETSFRNHVTRRVLQSNNIFTVVFCSKCNHVSRSRFAVNGITVMDISYSKTVVRPPSFPKGQRSKLCLI